MKRSLYYIILLFGIIAFSGCKKLLDLHSTHAVDEENFWNTRYDTRAALIGAYGLMRAALANNNAYWMYGELRDGDFTATKRQDLKSIISGNLNAPYPLLNDLSNWRRFYAVINAANMFLEHVDEVYKKDTLYNEQTRRVDVAQMRFLRAFSYFLMVRIWGDVPLITSSHDGDFEDKSRNDREEVLAFVTQELLAAAQDLPYVYSENDPQQQGDYYNESAGKWNGVLARKLSAYAVLAHVAAWQGNYPDAAKYAKFVLDNYSKESLYYVTTDQLTKSDGFFEGIQYNHLISFDFLWSKSDASFSGHLEELTLAKPLTDKELPDIYVPKDSILSIFDQKNDERFSLDTLTGQPTSERYFTNLNTNIPVFAKVKVLQNGASPNPHFRIFGSNIIFTRLEEITLLHAEAMVQVGNKPAAVVDLNKIRGLRELEDYDEIREGDLLHAIFRERRKELMGEGWRWYDLVRYNKIKQSDPAFMKLIREEGIFWPVSDDIIAQNGMIEQNSYWR